VPRCQSEYGRKIADCPSTQPS
ncbi:2-isopropylmalate synthase, partial [Gloeomargarita lithophora Alchichica-D10]